AVVRRLAAELNGLPAIRDPGAVLLCPRDDDSGIVAFFRYAGRAEPVRVDVKTMGCQGASNGWAVRDTTRGTGPQLQATLLRLVPVLERMCGQAFADRL